MKIRMLTLTGVVLATAVLTALFVGAFTAGCGSSGGGSGKSLFAADGGVPDVEIFGEAQLYINLDDYEWRDDTAADRRVVYCKMDISNREVIAADKVLRALVFDGDDRLLGIDEFFAFGSPLGAEGLSYYRVAIGIPAYVSPDDVDRIVVRMD